jgi:hypothetical protein
MDSPIAQSFLYVGGLSLAGYFVQKRLYPDGSIPGDGTMGVEMYAIPIGAAALGYFWYGQMGAVGGVAGAVAAAVLYRKFPVAV